MVGQIGGNKNAFLDMPVAAKQLVARHIKLQPHSIPPGEPLASILCCVLYVYESLWVMPDVTLATVNATTAALQACIDFCGTSLVSAYVSGVKSSLACADCLGGGAWQ